MGKKPPVTAAIRHLRSKKVTYEPFEYPYVERGGTGASSKALDTEEHRVIKTLTVSYTHLTLPTNREV